MFAAGASLALLDAFLRADPRCAAALRSRLALQSAAASAKIVRVNADEGALRDLRFAAGDALGPAANLSSLWRDLAGRPTSLDPGRIRDAAAALDLPAPNANALVESLRELRQGRGRSGLGGREGRRLRVLHLPGRPGGRSRNPRPLAVRPRPRHPAALAAARAADRRENSGPRSEVRSGRAARGPDEPAWSKAAAGAIALAAASALALAATFPAAPTPSSPSRPNCAPSAASKVVDLLLAEDCVSPAEAARQAPMTDRAARRLFDRLVTLGAVRELTGRPAFRLYGL